jgi:hypothetical protein
MAQAPKTWIPTGPPHAVAAARQAALPPIDRA